MIKLPWQTHVHAHHTQSNRNVSALSCKQTAPQMYKAWIWSEGEAQWRQTYISQWIRAYAAVKIKPQIN